MLVIVLFSIRYLLFFNHPATTAFYILSLHDALPIWDVLLVVGIDVTAVRIDGEQDGAVEAVLLAEDLRQHRAALLDRKSTRLNCSHLVISYAVFCLKKKKDTAFIIMYGFTYMDTVPH